MAASQFIALLESRGLLDPEIVTELRRQVEQSKGRLTVEAIAKLLVENGQLTRFQATKLVTELNESLGDDRPDPSRALRGGRPIPANGKESDDDSLADLLPDDTEDVVEVVDEVEDVTEAFVVPAAVTEAYAPSESSRMDLEDVPKHVVRDKSIPKKSAWESFRILGYGFIVLLLLIFLVPLLGWVFKGSADDAWNRAEEAYKGRDYEKSNKLYTEFANGYTNDSRASQGRILVGLSKIRQEAEKAADPTEALKACQAVLPTIANESSLGDLRGDVTDTLLRIAEKFSDKIANTVSIADRKTLVEKMNQQMDLIRDPRFVGTQERTQNELRIKQIEEKQNRLLRDINMGEDLASSIVAMTESVATKDVVKTYDLRRSLLRKYPQLQSDSKLSELMAEATKLQQGLVVNAPKRPVVNSDPVQVAAAPNALLVGRKTSASDSESMSNVYVRVAGSVVAVNSGSGRVLWRQHIGRDWTGEPKRITSTGDSDVLVYLPEKGVVRRLASADGAVVWETSVDGRMISPTIHGDDIYVPIVNGDVVCLDALTGQARWAKRFPQPIEVPIGGASTKSKKYVVGNHSNLYVVSRASGQCEEVLYLGHAPATIAVAPIWILNHLILFENDGPDYSSMRVYRTNDEGLELKQAQNAVAFRGHVVVEPQIDGRRIAVTTNLGEVAILDVDPSNQKDRVFKMVSLVENESTAKTTWPLMVGNELWLSSNRLLHYQIQVTSQKLNRQWVREDGDQFTGRPEKLDDVLVHARMVRGNRGVRVTGVKPGSGEPIWETDVGVPVTSISSDGKGFLAMTAQGALFSIDGKAFTSKQPSESIENLGRNQREMMFMNPVSFKDSRIALLNASKGTQLALLDPNKRTSVPGRLIPMEIGDAFPSAEAVALASGLLLVPLDNAQMVLLDPEKGKIVSTPYQPTIQAGERPVWLNPVLLSDNQTAIIADQQRFMTKLTTGRQLRSVVSQPLDRPLKGRLSVLKDVVIGITANASGDELDFFDSSELKKFASVPVEGRFAWGPFSIESDNVQLVMALSDIDGLIACDETGKKKWSVPLDNAVLVGKPIPIESDCLLATTSGELIRIAAATGEVVARVALGEPISGSPYVLPKGLLVPGDEGLLLTAPVPVAK
jgi:outer membrane protein assembly factor BamB